MEYEGNKSRNAKTKTSNENEFKIMGASLFTRFRLITLNDKGHQKMKNK
jgi:hypothetical protein